MFRITNLSGITRVHIYLDSFERTQTNQSTVSYMEFTHKKRQPNRVCECRMPRKEYEAVETISHIYFGFSYFVGFKILICIFFRSYFALVHPLSHDRLRLPHMHVWAVLWFKLKFSKITISPFFLHLSDCRLHDTNLFFVLRYRNENGENKHVGGCTRECSFLLYTFQVLQLSSVLLWH